MHIQASLFPKKEEKKFLIYKKSERFPSYTKRNHKDQNVVTFNQVFASRWGQGDNKLDLALSSHHLEAITQTNKNTSIPCTILTP